MSTPHPLPTALGSAQAFSLLNRNFFSPLLHAQVSGFVFPQHLRTTLGLMLFQYSQIEFHSNHVCVMK